MEKKIILDQSELEAMESFVSSGANYVKIIQKICDFYLKDLENINNIDPKGNVGLQTVARQLAHKTVSSIVSEIFPGLFAEEARPRVQKMSQWR